MHYTAELAIEGYPSLTKVVHALTTTLRDTCYMLNNNMGNDLKGNHWRMHDRGNWRGHSLVMGRYVFDAEQQGNPAEPHEQLRPPQII